MEQWLLGREKSNTWAASMMLRVGWRLTCRLSLLSRFNKSWQTSKWLSNVIIIPGSTRPPSCVINATLTVADNVQMPGNATTRPEPITLEAFVESATNVLTILPKAITTQSSGTEPVLRPRNSRRRTMTLWCKSREILKSLKRIKKSDELVLWPSLQRLQILIFANNPRKVLQTWVSNMASAKKDKKISIKIFLISHLK